MLKIFKYLLIITFILFNTAVSKAQDEGEAFQQIPSDEYSQQQVQETYPAPGIDAQEAFPEYPQQEQAEPVNPVPITTRQTPARVSAPKEKVDPEKATVTLELKNMDIVEVLKLLANKGGLDIVISQNVRGRITLFLDDVPIWDALQIVFNTSGLAYTKENNIYRILTDREYEQEFGVKFNDRREVKIIKLQYALAAEVSREIKQLKSRIGNVLTDDRTNSIVLLDTPQSIKVMEDALYDIDVPVETKIYVLTNTPAKSLEETIKSLISKKGVLHVDDVTNKIILTDIPDVIRQVDLVVKEYDNPTYLETKIFSLSHGKFDKVEEKVKTMITKDVGIITSDERTNKIVVTDLPIKIKEITSVVNAYDEPSRQVLIEAKIVQVQLKDQYSMGINWQLILNSVWVNKIFGTDMIDMTLSQVFETLSEINVTDTDPFDNSKRAAHPGGRSLVTGTLKDGTDFDAIVDALKIAGKTNLLSSPRILALNNQEAHLQVGTREAFVTNTVVQSGDVGTTAENVTFIDVGILLTVTPTIGEDGYVTLKIKPEISNVSRELPTAQGNVIPIVATQEAEATVMVKDGTTVIMGGLIEDQQYKTTSKVPIIGSLPILGVPFRKESNKILKNEIVIFLTPTIVTGDIDLNSPSPEMIKYLENVKKERDTAADEMDKLSSSQVVVKPLTEEDIKKQNLFNRREKHTNTE